MKVLGVTQFHQKTFSLLPIQDAQFKGLLGDVPCFFTAIIKGYSGNGKTEFCIQLAKFLTQFGKVLWLSYEQRHGYDLQKATKRNKMQEQNKNFLISDPLHGIDENTSLLEDLDAYLSKRNSADYVFFDSIDYTKFTWSDYDYLKNKYSEKKGFIFIAHSTKSGAFKKRISEQIGFDGGMIFHVDKFICYPEKNRFGGFEPFIIYEARARLLNPVFFSKHHPQGVQQQMDFEPTPKAAESDMQAIEVSAESNEQQEGESAPNTPQN